MKDSLPPGTRTRFTPTRDSPAIAPRRVPYISEFAFHGWEKPDSLSVASFARTRYPLSVTCRTSLSWNQRTVV
jgi:hypothetical protein